MPTAIGNKNAVISSGSIPISKASAGYDLVYSAGSVVTYYIDINDSHQEEIDAGATVLSPTSFIPAKEGWEFIGWRKDTVASRDVLDDLNMGDEPIELFAVFQQSVTLSYNANGGSGTITGETKQRYYNNNTVSNPEFTLSSNKFTAPTGYNFSKWAQGSASSGTQYTAGTTVTLSASTIFYAIWTYVGSPFYIVEAGFCKTALNWTITEYVNTRLDSANSWTVGMSWPTIRGALLDDSQSGSISARSAAIATKGNKTLQCTLQSIPSAGIEITVNGKTFTSNFTVDISNVSSITISVKAITNSYGYAYFQPLALRLY